MSIYITKDGQKKKVNVSATDVQLLDIDGRFKSKNLEDALKEVGSGTEENMTRIENKVEELSNPNLLVNGDFQIWSRGNSLNDFYEKENFSADKWICANNNENVFTVSKSKYGITFNSEQESGQSQRFRFHQNIEGAKRLNGKTLVFSFKVRDSIDRKLIFACGKNTVLDDTILVSQVITVKNGINTITFDIPNDTFSDVDELRIGFAFCCGDRFPYWGCSENIKYQAGSITFEWIKLEIGSTATPFIPKPYHEELLACNDGIIGSNPNLLINGDFQVWQRGTSFHQETATYCVDRWIISGDTHPKVEKIDNGVKITSTKNGTWTNFFTRLDNATLKKLIGKTLTYTIKLKVPTRMSQVWAVTVGAGGAEYYHSKVFNDKNYEYLTGSFVVKSTQFDDNGYFEFGIQGIPEANNSFEIEYAKLELGFVATPFVPRPYGEELALCQRYYEKTASDIMFMGAKTNTDYFVEYNYNVEKRVEPTIKLGNGIYQNQLYSFLPNRLSFMDVSHTDSEKKKVRIHIPLVNDDNIPPGTAVSFTGWLISDAEIY